MATRAGEHPYGLEEAFGDLLEVFGYGTATGMGAVLAWLPNASGTTTFSL